MGAANKLYNGNIAETFWSTATDGGFVRNYGYKYDNLNRLKDATYQKSGQLTNMYNENLSYDKNGNIMNLSRYGDRDEQYLPIQIDYLQYGYATNSNKLMSVVDNSNNTSGFKDGNTTGDDYVYDVNGNMTVDKNKNITSIVYNHLNLPTKIILPTGNIVYFYTASGQKVQKVVTENATLTTTDYLGGYQYQNTVLQFFPTAEGYVKNTPVSGTNTYSYVFNYSDHLGNTRLSYTKDPSTNVLTILDESSYYPFGLMHKGYNNLVSTNNPAEKLLFNGKELQDELGLDMYDFGARLYDRQLNIWRTPDPKAETSSRFSPYAYALNNPVFFIDPDGMQATYNWEEHNKGNKGVYTDGDKNVSYETALSQAGVDIHPDRAAKEGEYHHDVNDNTTYRGNSDGTWTQAIELNEVKVKGYKSPSYFQGYFDGPNSGEYGPSSMQPDAMSISYSGGVNSIFFSANINFGIALTGSDAAFVVGGNISKGLNGGMPGIKDGFQVGIHNNYGGNIDVLGGLGGKDVGYSAALGLGGSISNTMGKNGFASPSRVNTVGVNLGLSVGAGQTNSASSVFKLSDISTLAKKYF